MKLPSTTQLKAFLQVCEFRKIKTAAEAMHLSESTISHQLTKLETTLGQKLFIRKRNGIFLTDAGEQFLKEIEKPFFELESACEQLQSSQNRIRITMPRSFAALWFSPKMHALEEQVGQVEIDLLSTDRVCQLQRENIDFGIRMMDFDETRSDLLLREQITPICSTSTLKLIKKQGLFRYMQNYGVIVNQLHDDEWEQWSQYHNIELPTDIQKRKLPSFDLVLQATTNNYGLAMGRTPLFNHLLNSNLLQLPFAEQILPGQAYYLVSKQLKPKGFKGAFTDWIAQELKSISLNKT